MKRMKMRMKMRMLQVNVIWMVVNFLDYSLLRVDEMVDVT